MERRRGSMLVLLLLSGCCLALGSRPAGAEAEAEAPSVSPLVEACQRFASQHSRQVNPPHLVAVRLLDEGATAARYQGKVGSQPVATVVSGHGIGQEATGGPSNVRFTCLLEKPGTAVFVGLARDGSRDPVDVCWDGFEPAGWGKLTACLEAALKRAEADLAAAVQTAARQAGQSMDKVSAQKTLQESTAQWIAYRESECARQQAFVAGRNHPDIGELTCRIRETADRIADLQFDD